MLEEKMKVRNDFIIIGLILILASIYLYAKKEPPPQKPTWCILLTTCVQPLKDHMTDLEKIQRVMLYKKSIQMWLEKTTLPIFLVDSSNYSFPEFDGTRLHKTWFQQPPIKSSSQGESLSVLHALKVFEKELTPFTHICKVTGRYFVEDLDQALESAPFVKLVVQHIRTEGSNNSEIFGFERSFGTSFFSRMGELHFERHISQELATNTSYILPPLKNTLKVRRGGDNLLVDPL